MTDLSRSRKQPWSRPVSCVHVVPGRVPEPWRVCEHVNDTLSCLHRSSVADGKCVTRLHSVGRVPDRRLSPRQNTVNGASSPPLSSSPTTFGEQYVCTVNSGESPHGVISATARPSNDHHVTPLPLRDHSPADTEEEAANIHIYSRTRSPGLTGAAPEPVSA